MREFTLITKGESLDWVSANDITETLMPRFQREYFTVLDNDQLTAEAEAGYDVEALKDKPNRHIAMDVVNKATVVHTVKVDRYTFTYVTFQDLSDEELHMLHTIVPNHTTESWSSKGPQP